MVTSDSAGLRVIGRGSYPYDATRAQAAFCTVVFLHSSGPTGIAILQRARISCTPCAAIAADWPLAHDTLVGGGGALAFSNKISASINPGCHTWVCDRLTV